MKVDLIAEEIETLHDQADKVFYTSQFDFLNSHNGFRPGCLHAIISTSHGGKSTLVRSLIADLCLNKKPVNVLLWLSEETESEFVSEFFRSKIPTEKIKTLHILSEVDMADKIKTAKDVFSYMEMYLVENDIDVIFYDNITTSIAYMDRTPSEQGLVGVALKKLASKLQTPFVLIAHTGAQCTDNMSRIIEQNDIRGSKTIVNLIHFFYVMQSFHTSGKVVSTIRITKHRGQECENKLFQLTYSPKARMYARDVQLNFNEFKEIYKERDKL